MKEVIKSKLKIMKDEQKQILSKIMEYEEQNIECDRLYIVCAECKGMIFSLEWVLENWK